jgi:hypothetical protein
MAKALWNTQLAERLWKSRIFAPHRQVSISKRFSNGTFLGYGHMRVRNAFLGEQFFGAAKRKGRISLLKMFRI